MIVGCMQLRLDEYGSPEKKWPNFNFIITLRKIFPKILAHTIYTGKNCSPDANCVCSDVQCLWDAYILPRKRESNIRYAKFQPKTMKNNERATVGSKYYREHQRNCNILIMFTYLMTSKLIYIIMDCETFNQLPALEKVRELFRTTSNIHHETFSKQLAMSK